MNNATARDLLGAWGEPASQRIARLTPAARDLHRAILTTFAETGHAPEPATLDALAPVDRFAELAEHDLVHRAGDGSVRVAYPFSAGPTTHQVAIDGLATAYSMCAIDALGISAMLDRRVTITSAEPGTNRPITVTVDGVRATWAPGTAAVYVGTTDCCGLAADSTCGHLNFFTTPDAARAWAADNPALDGTVLDQDQALTLAIASFGDLLG